MDLPSRHVCITGVSRGLGMAMVRRFVQDGWRVSGCARSAEVLGRLAVECHEAGVLLLGCDVTDSQQVEQFAAAVLEDAGPPDLLINNAAIINRSAPLWEQQDEEVSRILDVNVRGVVSVIRCFVPAMRKRGSGIIVNFSSGWGALDIPRRGALLCQ